MISRFSLALIPLAAAMWAAHYLFHFLLGWDSAAPVFQRVFGQLGLAFGRQSRFSLPGPVISMEHLWGLQTVLLDLGLLATLYLGWRIARVYASSLRSAYAVMAPWAGVAVLLYSFGVWICVQPMQMRGLWAGSA